jgi:urease subunit beta
MGTPGEIRTAVGQIEFNTGRMTTEVMVVNKGDRPIQVGSHAHFLEVNRALSFDRLKAYGMRLHIASGTAVRFEPGEEKPVTLVAFGGMKLAYGMSNITAGKAEPGTDLPVEVLERLMKWEGDTP